MSCDIRSDVTDCAIYRVTPRDKLCDTEFADNKQCPCVIYQSKSPSLLSPKYSTHPIRHMFRHAVNDVIAIWGSHVTALN
jgi:hypothetical protein